MTESTGSPTPPILTRHPRSRPPLRLAPNPSVIVIYCVLESYSPSGAGWRLLQRPSDHPRALLWRRTRPRPSVRRREPTPPPTQIVSKQEAGSAECIGRRRLATSATSYKLRLGLLHHIHSTDLTDFRRGT